MASLVLGVDGGNTKSLALITDLEGRIAGTGRAGCGDIYATTPEAALAELARAIDAAMRQAGASPDDILAAGFSLAGADWPEDFTFLEAEMARHVAPATRIVVVNDALGALRAGTPAGEGLAVVCGTGSAIGARRGETTWHASFWGEDAGALPIGQAALRAIVRSELGIDPPVGFAREALGVLGAASVDSLLHEATRRGTPRTFLADLAPVVLDSADRGDEVAVRVISTAGQLLGEYARVGADRVGLSGSYPLILAGGVFRHPSPLLRSDVIAALPGAVVATAPLEPIAGALLLAFDRLDARIDFEGLRLSLPAHDAFGSTAAVTAAGR